MSWLQNNTVNFFEITNITANQRKSEVLSVVQETMNKYGNISFPVQV